MEVLKTYIVKTETANLFLFQTKCNKYYLQVFTPTGSCWVTDIEKIENDKALALIKSS